MTKPPLTGAQRTAVNSALAALNEAQRHIDFLKTIGDPEADELVLRAEHQKRLLTAIRDEYFGDR